MFTKDMQGQTRFRAAIEANQAMCTKLGLTRPDALVGMVMFWEESRVYLDPQRMDARSLWGKLMELEDKDGDEFGSGTSVGAGIQRSAIYFRQFAHIPHRRAVVLRARQ